MTIPNPKQCRFLEQLTEPYCPFQAVAIPGDVARPMLRMGWLDYNPPIAGPPLYTITDEGRQALHAAKALEGGR